MCQSISNHPTIRGCPDILWRLEIILSTQVSVSNWLEFWEPTIGKTVPPRDPDNDDEPETNRTTSRMRTASRRSSENRTNRRCCERVPSKRGGTSPQCGRIYCRES